MNSTYPQPSSRQSERPKSERRHLGGDFYLESHQAEVPGRLCLDVGFEHPAWRPPRFDATGKKSFPGSALAYAGRYYEITAVRDVGGLPTRTIYELEPWDETMTIRRPFELTEEACVAMTREHWQRKQRRATGEVLSLFPFVLGMLPAEEQKHLERDVGVPAVRNTFISSVVNLAISTLLGFIQIARFVGHEFGDLEPLLKSLVPWMPLFIYLGAETYFRFSAAVGNEPAGSLPVALPVTAVRKLVEGFSPGERLAAARQAAQERSGKLAMAIDEVRQRSDDYDLEVLSRLPKDHWTANVTAIYYHGEPYVLVEREVVHSDDGARYRFLLCRPEHAGVFTKITEYHPEEVREVYREKRRLDAAMWVEPMAIFWGFLDHGTQLRLARLYDYGPWKITGRNIAGITLLAAMIVGATVYRMLTDNVGTGDSIKFFGGLFLIWEAMVRWRGFRMGELRSSILGLPFKPLARRALRWE